ncbi:MAG TPA: DUF4238 domain-containing protein [Candidatus Avalokitesvara rifleensis]|uniref:DUF4238 domain-containing protein n=1 Tax=Candidatus Avalokitesvara rifleensis TaxID=3367620 RepID=UPI002712C1A1|nr:DUF4238 domain-containing protein [Candidatus Brocadiales bacterium]
MAKKRHHYIPQFYLKGFVDPNNEPYIWVYDIDSGKIMQTKAENIAYEKHYFSFIDKEGEKDSETIENQIAIIETEASKVINKILKYNTLNQMGKYTFAVFVALMMVRAPYFRRRAELLMKEMIKVYFKFWASNKAGFEASIRQFEKETGDRIGERVEEARQYFLNEGYKVKLHPQFGLRSTLIHLKELCTIFFGIRWEFIKASKEYRFLTGDNPLLYCDPTSRKGLGVGLMNNNIEVSIPLSKDLLALGTWKGLEGYRDATNYEIKELNRRTVSAALRFVFSSERSEALKRFIAENRGSGPGWIVG